MHLAKLSVAPAVPVTPESEMTMPLDPVRLPRDELAHPHEMEWWYFIAYLTTEHGKQVSVLCSAIRRRIVVNLTNCILNVVEHDVGPWPWMECGQPFRAAYRESRAPTGYRLDYGSNRLQRITCVDGRWFIEGEPGRYSLQGEVNTESLGPRAFSLHFQATSPAVPLCGNGIMDYGNGYRLAYYVRPKIDVSGRIDLVDGNHAVTGVGWYERQWGAWPGDTFGWKYLNIHLDDGEQWLIFSSIRDGLPKHYAARFPATGGVQELVLSPGQFVDVPLAGRPSGTHVSLTLDGQPLEIHVTPIFPTAPGLNSKYPAVPPLWEGVSTVECFRGGRLVNQGKGMTEIQHNG